MARGLASAPANESFQNVCQGYSLKLPAEANAFNRNFPLQVMGEPKAFESCEQRGVKLYSVSCQEVGDPSCAACSGLAGNTVVRGIEERAINEAPPRTVHSLLSHGGLVDVVGRRDVELNRRKLLALNSGRRASTMKKTLDVHKRFVLALSEKDVPRLRALMAQLQKRGGGLKCALPLCPVCRYTESIPESGRVIYSLTKSILEPFVGCIY